MSISSRAYRAACTGGAFPFPQTNDQGAGRGVPNGMLNWECRTFLILPRKHVARRLLACFEV